MLGPTNPQDLISDVRKKTDDKQILALCELIESQDRAISSAAKKLNILNFKEETSGRKLTSINYDANTFTLCDQ